MEFYELKLQSSFSKFCLSPEATKVTEKRQFRGQNSHRLYQTKSEKVEVTQSCRLMDHNLYSRLFMLLSLRFLLAAPYWPFFLCVNKVVLAASDLASGQSATHLLLLLHSVTDKSYYHIYEKLLQS